MNGKCSLRPARYAVVEIHHKGTVGSGNASWIRVFRPESYHIVLTRTALVERSRMELMQDMCNKLLYSVKQ
ncbi:hypothetical protein M9458_020015, partial [Cirrhinus mrigala]